MEKYRGRIIKTRPDKSGLMNNVSYPDKKMEQLHPLTHTVAFLLLLARLGDIGSTYLATPKLTLEANPIVRRFKWPFAWLTVLVAFLPYYSLALGIIILVTSLLVCASNFSRLWFMRAMGEVEYHELITNFAAKAHLPSAIVFILMPAVCIATIGLLLLYFYPDPNKHWGFFFAYGLFAYALAIGVWGPLAFLRFRREGKAKLTTQASGAGP